MWGTVMWALGTDSLGSDPSSATSYGALGQLRQVSKGRAPDLEIGLTRVPAFSAGLLRGNLITPRPQSPSCVGTGCSSSSGDCNSM